MFQSSVDAVLFVHTVVHFSSYVMSSSKEEVLPVRVS